MNQQRTDVSQGCDVNGNYKKVVEYLPRKDEVDIFILPEFHLTSWCPDHPDFLAATREASKFLTKYQVWARERNYNIVPGTICEVIDNIDGSPPEIRNSE